MSGYPGQNYQGGYQQGQAYQAPPGGWQQQPQYGQPPPNNQYQQPGQYPPPGGQPAYGQPPQAQGWGSPAPPNAYGAPPPNQYGAPQGQYGAPPPGQYGAPPPGQYGAPQYGAPPPNQYGAPPPGQFGAPPPNQYGAPPPNQFGAPPPNQFGAPPPNQFGAPPQQPWPPAGPRTLPSLGYDPMQIANIDCTNDVHAIRAAMKGFGTNEKTLIRILAPKDPLQINALRTQYTQRLARDLVGDLKSETSGYFENALVQIASGPLVADCLVLHKAIDRLGTKEAAIDDVLVGRSNADMLAIKAKYHELYGQTLEAALRGDLSAATEQMYMVIIAARRNEDAVPADPTQIEADVTELSGAMGNLLSKNADRVCALLFSRNDAQIRAIAQRYHARFHKSLDATIASKFSGHMQSALRLLVARAVDRPLAEAQRLEDAMRGIGTEDNLLVARVVRCHWDAQFMRLVAQAYKAKVKPGTELSKRIKGETSGCYRDLLLACVPERV